MMMKQQPFPQAIQQAAHALSHWLAASARAPRPLPWRALFLRLALPLWLTTRLLLVVETYLAQTLLRARSAQSGLGATVSLSDLVNSWRLWDGGFYRRILLHGYVASDPTRASFWPLYPLLAKPVELLLGPARWQIALLVVSNLALLAALVLLGALAMQELETLGAAQRAMLLLLAAPLALFLSAAYSDSLFLALACAAVLTARRGQWRLVILCAFLAALSRPVGIVLIAPLGWEYLRQHHRMRRVEWQGILLALAIPLAVGCYSLVCLVVYGDPLMWLHSQQRFFQHVTMAPWSSLGYTWDQFWHASSAQQARDLLDYVPLLLVLGVTLLTIRRIPVCYSLLLAGMVLVVLCTPVVGALFPETYVSAGRYLLPALPLSLLGAQLLKRWPTLEPILLGGGFALQALCVAFVLTGGWLV